jgi:hypothetical protein
MPFDSIARSLAGTAIRTMPRAATQNPSADGVADKGAQSGRFALEDHIHPGSGQARALFSKTGLNLNSTADQALTPAFAFTDYIVTDLVLSNVSTTLAASLATVGIYTGASGGGTTVVTAGLVQGLTSAAKTLGLTVLNGRLTSATLNAKLGVAHGSAATCDVHVIGVVLA